jgi:hypothetical protein
VTFGTHAWPRGTGCEASIRSVREEEAFVPNGPARQEPSFAARSGCTYVTERITAYLRRARDVLEGCPVGRLTQDPT